MTDPKRNWLQRRPGTEISTGLWFDPISEARHDYDGSQAMYEAALAQTKSIYDAVAGNTSQSLDQVWDAALDIAAHLALNYQAGPNDRTDGAVKRGIASAIRAMKKDR